MRANLLSRQGLGTNWNPSNAPLVERLKLSRTKKNMCVVPYGTWNGTFIRYVNVNRFLENLSALLSSSFLPLLLEREKKIIMRAIN